MRLINADEFLAEANKRLDMQDLYLPVHIKDMVIDEMSTVDAVPVVRCKDCVYCSSLFTVCTYNGRCEPVNTDDFCSMGERK